jgi:hypothetical protein
MKPFMTRIFPRTYCETPIKYRDFITNHYNNSKMLNFSKNGMYFEIRDPLAPESDICVLMVDYSPNAYGPEAFKSYLGTTKWCRELTNFDYGRYGIGVQLIAKSHDICSVNPQQIVHPCDMCSKPTAPDEIRLVEEYVYLCPACFDKLAVLPDDAAKKSLATII